MTTFKPRKLRDREEIDRVFLNAIACTMTHTGLMTGAVRTERMTKAQAQADFEGRAPHCGLWEIEPMLFAFYWLDTGAPIDREVHRITIICSMAQQGFILKAEGSTRHFFHSYIKGEMTHVEDRDYAWFTTDRDVANAMVLDLALRAEEIFEIVPHSHEVRRP